MDRTNGARGQVGANDLSPFRLLRQYGLDPDSWLESVERFGSFGFFVGHPDRLEKTAPRVGRKWLKGQKRARSTYARAA